MKKLLCMICIIIGIWYFTQTGLLPSPVAYKAHPDLADSEEGPAVSAQAALLVDLQSGQVLYRKNAHTRLYPASTTKILTALLALEYGDLEDIVTVGEEIHLVQPNSSTAELVPGQQIRLADLLYGLMLPSGNDAAYTIAVYVAGKINPAQAMSSQEAVDVFIDLMNQKARRLGADESHFANPDGYHDLRHYSTASDLSVIARAALQYPFFVQVTATEIYDYRCQESGAVHRQRSLYWKNTNLLLDQNSLYYEPDAIGVKTGYTKEAGYCLVAAVSNRQQQLLSVILRDTENEVWTDTIKLLEYGSSSP